MKRLSQARCFVSRSDQDVESLARRQQALIGALTDKAAQPAGLAALPGIDGGVTRGLQAYRVNAQALAARALASVFPQLREALADADEFDAMAWAFWRQSPPRQGDLACWGGGLAAFLSEQDGMDPALCDLARLEWTMHEAERAADAELDLDSLQLLGHCEPANLRLALRPGMALLEQHDGAALLVWRKGWRACSQVLPAGEGAFMRILLAGGNLAQALDAAGAVGDFDFSAWLQAALREHWLQSAIDLNNN